jgi:uncharacterized protein
MKRNVEIYLNEWKTRDRRKPLIIRGARQVGKTWSVDNFSKNFPYYIKIDFEENPEAVSIFRDNDVKRITDELAMTTGTPVTDGETLLFFDECQLCPDLFKTLRYFFEKRPNLHVVTAGSLIDFMLNDLEYPMPVGRVEFLYMYPLSFQEFLTAMDREYLNDFLMNFHVKDSVPPVVHGQMLELLRNYYFIGGMPEAVKEYAEKGDVLGVRRIQTELSTSIRTDFMKYGGKAEQLYLTDAFMYIARNTGKKIKYSNINGNVRSGVMKSAIDKLERARIIHRIVHTAGRGVPLGGDIKPEHFKTAFIDIGLSNRICGLELTDIRELLTIREGSLAEQFTAQELAVSFEPFEDRELYYWMRQRKNAHAEVDFLISGKNRVIPIEIKAGTTGSLKSLHVFMASRNNCPFAVRFNRDFPSLDNVSHDIRIGNETITARYKLLSLPLYMICQIKRLVEELL